MKRPSWRGFAVSPGMAQLAGAPRHPACRPALSYPVQPRLGPRRRHKGPLPILRARPRPPARRRAGCHPGGARDPVLRLAAGPTFISTRIGVIATGRLSRVASMLLRTSPGALRNPGDAHPSTALTPGRDLDSDGRGTRLAARLDPCWPVATLAACRDEIRRRMHHRGSQASSGWRATAAVRFCGFDLRNQTPPSPAPRSSQTEGPDDDCHSS